MTPRHKEGPPLKKGGSFFCNEFSPFLSHSRSLCFRLPDKADICLSFPINAGILWEKPRWRFSHEKGGAHLINTQTMPHGDIAGPQPSLPVGICSEVFPSISELSSVHPIPLFPLFIPLRVLMGPGSGHLSTVWRIFSWGKSGYELNAPPVRFGFV